MICIFQFLFLFIFFEGPEGKVLGEKRLMDDLLKNYNKNVLPRENRSDPLVVTLHINFKKIIELKEAEQIIRTNIWLAQSWTNAFLTWNPEDYGGIKTINLRKSKIWFPDVLLLNDVANETSKHFIGDTTLINLHYNGLHRSYFSLISLTSCPLDLSSFPFDEQICRIKLGTWTTDETRVILIHPTNFSRSSYQTNPSWELITGRIYHQSEYYNCCPRPFSSITLEIKIRRNSVFYGFILLFPITMSWIPILMGFIAPTETGERISFSISVLLTLVFYIEVANSSLPRNSDRIPLYGQYYAGVVAMISASTLFTAVVTKLFYSREYKLTRNFNTIEKSLLKFGARLPYIGPKCTSLVRLKMQHLAHARRNVTMATLADTNETVFQNQGFEDEENRERKDEQRLSNFVVRIQELSLDEGIVMDLDEPAKQSSSGLRRRAEQHGNKINVTKDNEQPDGKRYVSKYQKKLEQLKSIAMYLAKIISSMRKQKKKEKELDKQVRYARAVVHLVDRVILTTFTIILLIWFMVTIGNALIRISKQNG